MHKIKELFNLEKTMAAEYLGKFDYPWEAVSDISEFIFSLGQNLDENEYYFLAEGVWVHKSAKVAPSACIGAPCIIGKDSEVRHCAFIRSSALIGESCVIGNSTEIKNALLFDGVQVPHFNYIGDSILGFKAHFGAGAVTSNVKSDRSKVTVKAPDSIIETGLIKLGAFIGDYAEIGCNAVLNPGTVIGKNTSVYPLTSLRGVYPADCIVKDQKTVVKRV